MIGHRGRRKVVLHLVISGWPLTRLVLLLSWDVQAHPRFKSHRSPDTTVHQTYNAHEIRTMGYDKYRLSIEPKSVALYQKPAGTATVWHNRF